MVMVREAPISPRKQGQGKVSRLPGGGLQCIGHHDVMERELADFQHLIDHLTADGRLARRDGEVILSALVSGEPFSTAKCALFRQLQERVWRAEIYLEPESGL